MRQKSLCVSWSVLLQVNTNSTLKLLGNDLLKNVHEENIPSVEEELVEWAKQRFGGVTSFTTIRNLKMVKWTGVKGENCSYADKILQYCPFCTYLILKELLQLILLCTELAAPWRLQQEVTSQRALCVLFSLLLLY